MYYYSKTVFKTILQDIYNIRNASKARKRNMNDRTICFKVQDWQKRRIKREIA